MEIVRDLGVSRNTVRKVLRSGETAFAYERSVQPLPKLGPWASDLCRLLEANGNGTVTVGPGSATGNRLPFASDFNGTFGFTYRADLSRRLTADFALSNLYSTGFYTQPDNYLKQSSYITTNASVNFKIDDGRFNVKFWVNNLFDEDVLTIASAASTLQFASYAAPRTYGISVGTKF